MFLSKTGRKFRPPKAQIDPVTGISRCGFRPDTGDLKGERVYRGDIFKPGTELPEPDFHPDLRATTLIRLIGKLGKMSAALILPWRQPAGQPLRNPLSLSQALTVGARRLHGKTQQRQKWRQRKAEPQGLREGVATPSS